jgi:enoyl-[acyl-carrier-protein] reductase (NADH)
MASTGVTINAVLPGPTMSDGVLAMWDDMYPGLDRDEQEARFVATGRAATSLLGRLIRPTEVAHLITYLASDQASGTTGAALSVDGGLVPTIFPTYGSLAATSRSWPPSACRQRRAMTRRADSPSRSQSRAR